MDTIAHEIVTFLVSSLVFYVRPLTTTPITTTTSTTQPSTATSSAATSSETDALIRRKPSDINIVYSVAGQNFTEGADFANPGEPGNAVAFILSIRLLTIQCTS